MGSHASLPPQPATGRRTALRQRFRRHAVTAVAATAGFTIVAAVTYAGVTLALQAFGRPAANGCVVGTCQSATSASPMTPDFGLRATQVRPTASASPHRQHTRTPSPVPVQPTRLSHWPPAARSPQPPSVSVTFLVVKRWPGGFEGQITISNHGSATVQNWTIVLSLPDDRVFSVWNAEGQTVGGTLVLRPASWDPPIRAGGELSVFFVANGPVSSPSSCTYNGTACG